MKKNLLLLMILSNIVSLGFSLNSLEFDESLKKGEVKEKEYILKNNTEEIKKYSISTEADNVEINPDNFLLSPENEKKFVIKVRGSGNEGENSYFITISEKNITKRDESKNDVPNNRLYLNKFIKIKQKYYILK